MSILAPASTPELIPSITQTTVTHQNEPGVLIWVPLSHLQHHVQLEQQMDMEREQQQQQQQLLEQQHLQNQIEQERIQLEHLINLQHHMELQQHIQQMHHQVPLENQDAMVVPGTGVMAGGVLGGPDAFYSPHDDILGGGMGVVGGPPTTTTVHHQQDIMVPGAGPQLTHSQLTVTPHMPQIHPQLISPVEMLLRQHQLWATDLNGDVILPQVNVPPETLRQPISYPEEGMGVEQMTHQLETPMAFPEHYLFRQAETPQAAEAMMMMGPPPNPPSTTSSTPTTTTTTERPPTVLREVQKKSVIITPSSTIQTPLPSTNASQTPVPLTIPTSVKPTVLKEATNDVEQIDKEKKKL